MGSTIKAWLAKDKNSSYLDFFKKAGFTWRLVLLGLVGIMLLLASTWLDKPLAPSAPPAQTSAQSETVKTISSANLSYEENLENKLANLLSQIKGAGSVSVNITLERGTLSEHAQNITRETRVSEERDSAGGVRTTTESKETSQVLFSKEGSTDRPVIAREYKPVIKGVVVIAEGAGDSRVKADITRAVEAGLGLAPHKIAVLAQRKRGD